MSSQQQQQQQQEQRPPPPAYAQHEPESLYLPSVPTHALPSHHNDRLPGIRSLDLPNSAHGARFAPDLSPKNASHSSTSHGSLNELPTLPPLSSATFPRVPDSLPRHTTEMDIGSPMDTASVVSMQDDVARRRELSVLSMDDPDVRLAAEALSGLGNPDFVRSPTSRSLTLPRDSSSGSGPEEPLLSLITSNHPWLGGTINGSISAYNATKGFSPRFVKYGAELIERNIGSPMVNSVSSVSRRTGVDKSLRRYLGEGHRRPSDLEQGDTDAARKRQRRTSPASDAMDTDEGVSSRTRGQSHSSYAETLPAYDDHRSPQYEENASVVVVVDPATGKEVESRSSTPQDRRVNWSTQLIMTTSGLGVALSDKSLRSLKMCLKLLRSATKHIDDVMHALKLLLEDYEAALHSRRQSHGSTDIDTKMDIIESEEDDRVRELATRMKSLSDDIWKTLKSVVQSVSYYTGGALPQNASQVVRTQLMSVPTRWQTAQRSVAGGETAERGEEALGANRMLAFAKEGLNMMGEITKVVDGTIQSAETWLQRIGRKTPQESEPRTQQASEEKGGAVVRQEEIRDAKF